jgi:hypothetical protein
VIDLLSGIHNNWEWATPRSPFSRGGFKNNPKRNGNIFGGWGQDFC